MTHYTNNYAGAKQAVRDYCKPSEKDALTECRRIFMDLGASNLQRLPPELYHVLIERLGYKVYDIENNYKKALDT